MLQALLAHDQVLASGPEHHRVLGPAGSGLLGQLLGVDDDRAGNLLDFGQDAADFRIVGDVDEGVGAGDDPAVGLEEVEVAEGFQRLNT